ncbi:MULTISPECIES: hypothetical protein [Streptomyces]|uniref:Uncharacterized protein n=1 Tax=Streptomyces caniscabiei TaxID=2746961 RepID=A0ABU4MZC7_9ACTN|nr:MULTISPECIES: hypothetical protein [Streptomyces]MBE4733549.1 hypothetical protein [Streptomyces caniscabiei]MBE4754726.1 hypothetical protein [Streptomyces caniscabiei]MBE4782044.1 hypothetical protein [Streptomyces caniscabiei]MBE4793332.1 hypothetical protein [Streptomyces caniscabiei]MDX2940564.1 hypothetical protein [Streptomyces caniscabiei]
MAIVEAAHHEVIHLARRTPLLGRRPYGSGRRTRAAGVTGRRPNTPSPSATWSRIFAAAGTDDTVAASRAPSPCARRGAPWPSREYERDRVPALRSPLTWTLCRSSGHR